MREKRPPPLESGGAPPVEAPLINESEVAGEEWDTTSRELLYTTVYLDCVKELTKEHRGTRTYRMITLRFDTAEQGVHKAITLRDERVVCETRKTRGLKY